MVVEQKVTSMTTLKIKSYLLGPILNNFQRGLGKKILPFHFLNLHHEFGNSFFSKFWHINQKKFMKQKRQQIDHRVAWRRPFLRFQLHFWDIVAGATHRRGRSNPPKAGATHRRCASPPWLTFERLITRISLLIEDPLHYFSFFWDCENYITDGRFR